MIEKKRLTAYVLCAVFVVSIGLHLYRLDYPDWPVFDEAHFVTYAADYVEQQAYFDIHPPLGKLLYASVLQAAVGGQPLGDTEFVRLWNDPYTGRLEITDKTHPYGPMPYVPLRLLGAFFGVLLPFVFYFFLRSIGVGAMGSLLGAVFVVFENALLLETRLILLNGMFLTFGLLALAFYFKEKPWPLAGGVFFGLSLGVKLTGIIFLGPIVLYELLRPRAERSRLLNLGAFVAVGFSMFMLVFSLNNVFFTPQSRIDVWRSFDLLERKGGGPAREIGVRPTRFAVTSLEAVLGASGYLGIGGKGKDDAPQDELTSRYLSSWYEWPFMQSPILYFFEEGTGDSRALVLVGNPAVWFGGTLGVFLTLALLGRRFIKEKQGLREVYRDAFPAVVLLGGYASSLLPFLSIVKRTTLLYHYFPALLFSVGLLAWFLSRYLRLDDQKAFRKHQTIFIALVFVVVVSSFVLVAPFTYGLPESSTISL